MIRIFEAAGGDVGLRRLAAEWETFARACRDAEPALTDPQTWTTSWSSHGDR
jgi:hypothetical protein